MLDGFYQYLNTLSPEPTTPRSLSSPEEMEMQRKNNSACLRYGYAGSQLFNILERRWD
jgi:hypothetical protein